MQPEEAFVGLEYQIKNLKKTTTTGTGRNKLDSVQILWIMIYFDALIYLINP